MANGSTINEELPNNTDALKFIESVKNGNITEVKELIKHTAVDSPGKEGMTALMYAAYKGNVEMVELLIANGANVNCDLQKDKYTPLMFAALSGSTTVCRLLLEAGANPNALNKINRTASQLGAFVGRHDCVSLINNFVERDKIDYYTKPQGLESEGKIPAHLSSFLHELIILPNLNPIKVILFLQNHQDLIEERKSIIKVLDSESSKAFKNVNEVLSIKLHIFQYVLLQSCEWLDKGKTLKSFVKFLLKSESNDGEFHMNKEMLLRASLKSYTYANQSNIFKQIVKTLSTVTPGENPSALMVITQSLNGIQSADFSDCCNCCGERHCLKKCGACKSVRYCSTDCQQLHWSTHKIFCKKLKAERERQLAMEKEESEKCNENESVNKTVHCAKSDNGDVDKNDRDDKKNVNDNNTTISTSCDGDTNVET